MVINVDNLKKFVTTVYYHKQHVLICNRFHGRRANSGKIKTL